MASHARRTPFSVPRALRRAGLLVSAAGAALGAAGGTASAAVTPDPPPIETPFGRFDAAAMADPVATLGAVTPYVLDGGIGPIKNHQLDPLAGSGVDPLDNGIGTQIADFKPVGTQTLTGPVTEGASLGELPVLRPVSGLIPG